MSGETHAAREALAVYATKAPETEYVPPGYRQTEVGVIPEEWELLTLEEVCGPGGLVRGPFGGALKKEFFVDASGYKVYEQRNAIYKSAELGTYFVDESKFRELSRFEVRVGDFIVSCSGTIGRVFQIPEEAKVGIINQALLKIKVDSKTVLDRYFFYVFESDQFQKRIIDNTHGGAMQNLVGMDTFRNTELPIPPLSEQRAIAAALSDVDTLISSLDSLIAKKCAVKSAAMQQLLTGKQRLPGFSGKWSDVLLGEFGSFSKGRGIKKDEIVLDGLPCVRYGEIYTLHHDQIKQFHSFIPADVAQGSQRIKQGDLLFAGSGETKEEIGKCVAYLGDEEAYAGGDIVIFSPGTNDSRFLGYLMNHASIASQKASMGQGDAVVHINAGNLAKLRFLLPRTEEQTAIATVLSDMDAEISALEARLEKTRQVKQGMMQELLTGRTRLV